MQEKNIKFGLNLKCKDTLIMKSSVFQEENSLYALQTKYQEESKKQFPTTLSQTDKKYAIYFSQIQIA